jgi:hypothetical protein
MSYDDTIIPDTLAKIADRARDHRRNRRLELPINVLPSPVSQ